MEIILLHQTGPLVIDPRWRLLYSTRQAPSYVPQMEIPLIKDSANLPRWRFHYYTIQAPMNLPLMEITLLHQPCYFTQMVITVLCLPSLCTQDGDYPTIPPAANLPQMGITVLYQTGPFLCTPDGDSPNKALSASLPRLRFPYYTTPANFP